MCTGPKRKVSPTEEVLMEDNLHDDKKTSLNNPHPHPSSLLLEYSATDDLESFQNLIENSNHPIDEVSLWYGREIGSKKMGFQERTPLMIAAMLGSKRVLNYILQKGVDVNRACGPDGPTALHCAVAGGSAALDEVVSILIDFGCDANLPDANGNTPADLIPPSFDPSSKLRRKRALEILLNRSPEETEQHVQQQQQQQQQGQQEQLQQEQQQQKIEKKEYPVDPSLPDIKNGIYGTDEFRMYAFKIKPCSRAYSHDWTECPFVHPGENARRRDPRKYHYSCVPCPEFRKGACPKGDACEYAHGIFECWLHPAQYRTRLCKDETNCNRRVCFFAHKPEELRPLYASTGSGVPSPRSYGSSGGFDMAPPLSPLGGIGSPSMAMMVPPTSTPPLTPTGGSSPIGAGGSAWTNHMKLTPPALQLPSSRLKAALSARDMNLQAELQKQQLLGEFGGVLSPSSWTSPRVGGGGALNPANLDDLFGTMTLTPQMNHHNQQSLRSSFGMDPSSPVANPRLAAFANRSHSFIDRGRPGSPNGMVMPAHLSDWGSPDGKVDWGVQGDELNKLRKSASFGFRTSGAHIMGGSLGKVGDNEPDVSWVQSLVKDSNSSVGAPTAGQSAHLGFSEEQLIKKQQQQYHQIPPWVEQMYMEQEPMAA